MEKKESKMKLTSLDDLFTTEEERKSKGNILDISIKDIDNFPNHPFKVNVDEELLKSINESGVLSPAIVRPKANNKYEMISGHRRKKACEKLHLETIPCIIREYTDEEAIIMMVDSNLQREHILPSERAYAYKMKLDAINHQGRRTDLTSCQVGTKLQTAKEMGEEFGDSERQVFRYIRLTELIKPLLEMVDSEKIAFNPAVELSYLNNEEQKDLLDLINCYDSTPSLTQAIKLKKLSQEKKLTLESMEEIISEEKPNQIPKLKLDLDELETKMPRGLSQDKYTEYIFKALDFYKKYLEKKKENQER